MRIVRKTVAIISELSVERRGGAATKTTTGDQQSDVHNYESLHK